MKTTSSKLPYKIHTLIDDMSSETYHSISGTYSSSQFKDLLDDEEVFIKKYIHKTVQKESIPAFDVGTYFHTGVLEPHKLKMDCAIYPGKIRRGKEWEKFLKDNKGKAILNDMQVTQAKGLIECAQASPVTMGYVSRGKPEVSLFTEIMIWRGDIYAPYFGRVLTVNGWEKHILSRDRVRSGVTNLVIKVRADSLGDDFILDLKSTTGNAKSVFSMRQKISAYQYDLSAALYIDMFSLINPAIKEFVWAFASKDYFNCRSYRASETNIKVGRAKYMKALLKLAECKKNEWQVFDCIGELEPLPYELEYIKEKETDLI